ncbi:short-chain dehydrogenase TIC 32, chloroplastic [Triticum aestivum]|uniref:short-chain dehydrogenase TIC 32, chloroplastic n=1 Tax=Triticum aestivum TaxID=4565 RepID=UPI001D012BBA|nr:short-chain dehydrogenase TIC 32, chloroplastic-like [Triticum aestivum]
MRSFLPLFVRPDPAVIIASETACVLEARGAHVVMTVRNLAAAEAARHAVLAENPAANLDLMELDLPGLHLPGLRPQLRRAHRGLPLNILMMLRLLLTCFLMPQQRTICGFFSGAVFVAPHVQ